MTSRRALGFTLIEIIVAITIIAILSGLVLMVGHHVRGNAQTTATRDLLKVLDMAYASVTSEKESNVPATWTDDSGNQFGVVDGRVDGAAADEPSLALFVLSTGSHQLVKDAILRADSKYVTNSASTSYQLRTNGMDIASAPSLKDTWGNPIRFVHPRYSGGYGRYVSAGGASADRPNYQMSAKRGVNGQSVTVNFIRSYRLGVGQGGTADEGITAGGRGYFYSAGPDRDPGTRDDNVYLDAMPQFPAETAKLR